MEQTFKTKNESPAFWAGYARQTIDFHAALGELIDNALSATLPKAVGEGRQTAVVEIAIHEQTSGAIRVHVADAGTGIAWDQLVGEDNVFNLGYRPPTTGAMNEHGFGLKNALALMTSGFQTDFLLITKPVDDAGSLFGVAGPIDREMTARSHDEDEWEEGLDLLREAPSGVKVSVDVQLEYFRTVYSRGGVFDSLVQRLAEHLGVMYFQYLQEGNEIALRYRSKDAEQWTSRTIVPIPTPFLQNVEVSKTEHKLEFEVDGATYRATYIQGLLDRSVKETDSELPWPYPLKIHFQGSNARCGISYIVRRRVLKTGVFREIWPELAGDVSFNNFLGELHLDAHFATTNNKTDLDPHTKVWTELVAQVRSAFEPEKATKKQSEEGFRKKVIKQLGTVHGLTGADLPKHKVVWDGGAEIDVYYELDGESFLLETKVDQAMVKDVYQLLMYWDGLVKEGKEPKKGTLIAASIPPTVEAAISHVNGLKDHAGKAYALEAHPLVNWIT